MVELPEIVRQRLARQAGGAHPDPDLLTAFAEGLLTQRERTQVLAHLGTCATCREVVSLSLPEAPALQPAPVPVKGGWLRWPVLRWGAVAAAVVIVGAAVMLRQPRRAAVMEGGREPSVSTYTGTAPAKPAEPPSRDEVAGPTSLDKESRAEAKDVKSKTAVPKVAAPTDAIAPTEAAKKAEVGVTHKIAPPIPTQSMHENAVVVDQQQRRDQAPQLQYQAAPAPGQAAGVQTGVTGGALQKQDQLSMSQQQAASAPQVVAGPMPMAKRGTTAAQQAEVAPPAAPPQSRVQQNIVADERAVAASAGAALPTVTNEAVMMKSALRASPMSRWRVSSGGDLERSLDAGGSWRVVPVKGAASFRALSAIGDDVWAGGSAGALYHSTNGGQTWTRVVARQGEIALTSDIIRIEFTDPLHGVVATASGETWVTADGGRTWSARRQ